MNTLGIALVWCILQVTIVGLLVGVMYLVLQRLRPTAAASAVLAGLVMVVILSFFAISPWPCWTSHNLSSSANQVAFDAPPSPDKASVPINNTAAAAEAEKSASAKNIAETKTQPSSAAIFWQALREELSRPQTAAATTWRWPAVLAISLIGSMIFGLAWLLLGVVAVRRERHRSDPVRDTAILELVEVLCAELGCHRPIEVRQTNTLATAATIGWRRPVLLLPTDWTAWTDEQCRAVLAHEIAHARSHDFVTLLVGQFGLTLHYYHPLMHWMMNRLRLEQELAADAAAASVSGGQRQYLVTIAELALHQQDRPLLWPARTFLPTRTTFLRRIAMLRDSKLQIDRLSPSGRLLTVGAVLLCGLLVIGLRGPTGPQQVKADDAKTADEARSVALPTTEEKIDWSLIPNNAIMVATARPAAILQRPEFVEFKKLDDGNPSSLRISELEQFTFALLGLPATVGPSGTSRPSMIIVFRMTKPNQFEQFLHERPGIEKKEFQGKTYFLANGNNRISADCSAGIQLDDRTLVLGATEEDLQNYLRLLNSRNDYLGLPKFIDANQWKTFQNDQAVVAVRAKTAEEIVKLLEQAPTQPGAMIAPFSPLWQETTQALAGIRFGEEMTVHANFMAKDKDAAEKVEKTIQAVQTLALNSSKQFRAQLSQGRPGQTPLFLPTVLNVAETLGDNLQIKREGTQVSLQTSLVMANLQKMLPPIMAARDAARRAQSMHNVKEIAIGLLNYQDALKCFPPPVLYGPDGKTPYSWRVALLRFIEEGDLYKQYHFDEPWDGPNNIKLLDKMPRVFRNPMEPANSHNSSYYVFVGPGTIFEPREPGSSPRNRGTRIMEIVDGMHNTLLLVEAKRDIPWTKPEDIPYEADKPLPQLGGYFEGGFVASLADGSVRFFSKTIEEKILRLLINKADRQPVEIPPEAR